MNKSLLLLITVASFFVSCQRTTGNTNADKENVTEKIEQKPAATPVATVATKTVEKVEEVAVATKEAVNKTAAKTAKSTETAVTDKKEATKGAAKTSAKEIVRKDPDVVLTQTAPKKAPASSKTTPAKKETVVAKAATTAKKETTTQAVKKEATTKPAVKTGTAPAPSIKKEVKEKVDLNSLSAFQKMSNDFFGKYVSGGRVAYGSINKAALQGMTDLIAKMDLSSASKAEKQAFYINAYNVLVFKSVLDNNQPASPLDVGDFFKASKHKVAGNTTSLDALEKKTLMGLKNDPRYHFVLVCGAVGCPQIVNYAYDANKLESQMDQRTRTTLNDPDFIRVDKGASKVSLSKIFEWYAGDFGGSKEAIVQYINKYRSEKIPADYAVDYYEYDWKLNKK